MSRFRRDGTRDYVVLHSLGPIVGSMAKILDPDAPSLQERGERAGLFEECEGLADCFDALLDG
ncbi:MAG: hypothetical protein WCE80_08615 [Acidimicrobiia bacterium]